MTNQTNAHNPLAQLVARAETSLAERLHHAGALVALEADAALNEFHAVSASYLAVIAADPAPDDLPEDFAVDFLETHLAKEAQVLFDNAFRKAEARRSSCADMWKTTIKTKRNQARLAALQRPGG